MARESREERFVKTMISQLTERMFELKNLNAVDCKETEVEAWVQNVFKSVLGFSASAGYIIRTQEARGKARFDITIARSEKPDQVLIVAEVKKLDADLGKSDFRSGKTQLLEYLKLLGSVRYGILTNGNEWRLYDFKNNMTQITELDLRGEQKEIDTASKAIQDMAWDLFEFSSHYYEKKIWDEMSTEAMALSPDSLAKAVLSVDIVKQIGKIVDANHDYKAPVDMLTEKLADLLEHGLNDSLVGWNDTKKAELDRYIRSQKKQAKRTKKRKSTPDSAAPEVAPVAAAPTPATQTEPAATSEAKDDTSKPKAA